MFLKYNTYKSVIICYKSFTGQVVIVDKYMANHYSLQISSSVL